MKQQERSDLKLVNWVNDKCPPIDLSMHGSDIVKLVSAYNDLKKLSVINDDDKIYSLYKILEPCPLKSYLGAWFSGNPVRQNNEESVEPKADWDRDFVFAVDVLLECKPKQMSISKAVEELLELSTKLVQYHNDNKKVPVEEIKEEVVDVSMHIFLLHKLFGVTHADIRLKVDKFLNSADYQNYLTLYSGTAKDWEILEFSADNLPNAKLCSDGLYRQRELGQQAGSTEKEMLRLWQIHSVRRLSDNIVFSVGEDSKWGIIKGFEIRDGKMIVLYLWLNGKEEKCLPKSFSII